MIDLVLDGIALLGYLLRQALRVVWTLIVATGILGLMMTALIGYLALLLWAGWKLT